MHIAGFGNTSIIDERLRISAAEIVDLWQHGLPTEDSLALLQGGEPYIRAKRSENGKWHLKQFPLDPGVLNDSRVISDRDESTRGFNAEQLCQINDHEHHRLKLLGYHIITFARVPFNGLQNISTVAPWIDGMEDPPLDVYYADIEPIEKAYLDEWAEELQNGTSIRPFHAVDLEQVATLPGLSAYFLYDTDPAVSDYFC